MTQTTPRKVMKLDIGSRIHSHLVRIMDEPFLKSKARKKTTCVATGNPINVGDWVYRPLGNSKIRSTRILAEEVERQEAQYVTR